MSSQSQTIAQPNPKRWKALALLAFANFLVMMDAAIIQIALPAIKNSLGYTEANLQWVMNAFLILFGGLLLLGGRCRCYLRYSSIDSDCLRYRYSRT